MIFFIVGVLMVLSFGASILLYIKYFRPKPPPLVKPQSQINLQSLENVAPFVKPIGAGLSPPQTDSQGNTMVTITGTLSKATLESDGHYFFEIKRVKYNNKDYSFFVDLGPKDFKISEEEVTLTQKPTSANPNAIAITQVTKTVSAEELYIKYKDSPEKLLALSMLTSMRSTYPKEIQNCSSVCIDRINFFKQYESKNKVLEVPDALDPKLPWTVGVVSQVNGGQYAL